MAVFGKEPATTTTTHGDIFFSPKSRHGVIPKKTCGHSLLDKLKSGAFVKKNYPRFNVMVANKSSRKNDGSKGAQVFEGGAGCRQPKKGRWGMRMTQAKTGACMKGEGALGRGNYRGCVQWR